MQATVTSGVSRPRRLWALEEASPQKQRAPWAFTMCICSR